MRVQVVAPEFGWYFDVWASDAVQVVTFWAASPTVFFGGIVTVIQSQVHSDLLRWDIIEAFPGSMRMIEL